jgi:hypothetical protein
LFSHPIDFYKSLVSGNLEKNTLDWGSNPMYGKTPQQQSVNVTPSAPVVASPYYGAGVRTGGEAPSIEHMTVNVAIDKEGAATANVNGAKPRRIEATLSPYRTAQ